MSTAGMWKVTTGTISPQRGMNCSGMVIIRRRKFDGKSKHPIMIDGTCGGGINSGQVGSNTGTNTPVGQAGSVVMYPASSHTPPDTSPPTYGMSTVGSRNPLMIGCSAPYSLGSAATAVNSTTHTAWLVDVVYFWVTVGPVVMVTWLKNRSYSGRHVVRSMVGGMITVVDPVMNGSPPSTSCGPGAYGVPPLTTTGPGACAVPPSMTMRSTI